MFRCASILQLTHPRLEDNYTGHGKTHCWNINFWSFLTKTKRTWPFPSHFQSKFLLGALRLALWNFDPKISIILRYSHIACLHQPDCTQLCINMLCQRPEVPFDTIKIRWVPILSLGICFLAQKCQKWAFFGPKCCFWAKNHFLEGSTKTFGTIMTEHCKIVFTALHWGFQAAAVFPILQTGSYLWKDGRFLNKNSSLTLSMCPK